jgi:hypothetical protein
VKPGWFVPIWCTSTPAGGVEWGSPRLGTGAYSVEHTCVRLSLNSGWVVDPTSSSNTYTCVCVCVCVCVSAHSLEGPRSPPRVNSTSPCLGGLPAPACQHLFVWLWLPQPSAKQIDFQFRLTLRSGTKRGPPPPMPLVFVIE